ncbi:uncharacterized protein [Drosophila virilis]|uniref:uncharacterized protein n=1 Tax=Drosophila virilis TaxID=7244 RepID=UPI0038B2B243
MKTMHDYKQKGYMRRLKDSSDTLASLMGVLIRFRERPIAVSDDIREMFHQVKVRLADQPALKFLWRDGDSSRFPETYVMQVMTFGASCSPALANYVKNRNAERFVAEQPDAVKAICENTFVDDWLQSVDTGAEMIQLAATVKRIHASGGFEMRRWTSNSKQVIQALEDDCEELDKRIRAQDEPQETVLGLWWLPGQDLLTFLGLLGFFNIRAKIILRNIWRSNIGWDDDLTNEDEADWQHWLDLVSNLNAVRITRCMKWVSRTQAAQMHTFVDASMNAYAAVVFLRAELDGQVHCCLVASKTRVAPLKPVSIPRMELMAAVLGLRLAKCIQKEVSVRIHRRTFWTDSKDVLYWIRSDARKFQQLVALRIGEILEESDVDSWRWVPSAQNVADDGTKWTKTPEIHGSTSVPDLQRFSKLEKLRAVQLCVLDSLRNITKKVRLDGGLDLQKTLLLKRSNEMDVIFIRICQEEEFYNDSGILRIKGRIDNIEGVEVCVKRPIILPRRHQLTYLLVEFHHRRYHHLHNEIVVNELRQRYWACGLRALVREVSNTCPACRIRRTRPKPPGMGDLPIERLSHYTPPFTFTGVDYFGPYNIVVRRREKRWDVLFTCLTVRAVNLDIATSLSTDSYLCVLKSFVARSCCPRRMLSDNGTNFRGASRDHMGGSWERMVRSTKSILSEILPASGLRKEVLRAALAGVESVLNSRPLTYVPLVI